MSERVLVTHATKHGSTRAVAEEIARTLAEEGLLADVRPAAEVDDLEPYAVVVLGGSLYMTRWHADAIHFLHRHSAALRDRVLAVYAMGPLSLAERDVAASRHQLERVLRRLPEVDPAEVAIFGGVVDPSVLHFPFNRMPASDARDPEAIAAWARWIAVLARRHAGIGGTPARG
jgi:menaquinone-dependent protoporphyrinogen oxidase